MAHTQLRSAAEDLVGLLQKSENALDAVGRKVDEEFAERYKNSGLNPLLLSKRIKRLSMQIPSLKAECQALIQRKQALIDAAKQQLLANRTQLHELSSRCGVSVQEDPAMIDDFTEALADWDKQAALQSKGLADQPFYMSREELNHALAGSMLARQ